MQRLPTRIACQLRATKFTRLNAKIPSFLSDLTNSGLGTGVVIGYPGDKHTFVRQRLTLAMKTNTTKNLASAGILVLLSPFLLLAIIVSVKNSGVVRNDMLLLLLTLTGAVVTGINGFGRRTSKPAPVATRPAKLDSGRQSDRSISWSSRHSSNA